MPTPTGGKMILETLALVLGSSGFVSAVARALAIWRRSRHPGRVTVRVGGTELRLDLSNPTDAERYLQHIAKPDSKEL
ncbi:hypothetical protein [Streptomyces sp. SID3212]|uniref:effector-associated constant component EACC1 n=1 Tax=Streptomyces sp. SID3212 TaxID=2690259 RepID=UPI0031F6BD6B